MIAVITTPHWGDLMLLGLLVIGVVCGCYLGVRLIDLVIAAMRPRPPLEVIGYADFHDDPAGGDMTAIMESLTEKHTEPVWQGKAQFDAPADPTSVPSVVLHLATGGPVDRPGTIALAGVVPIHGVLSETPAETSGRHARVEADDNPTGLMEPVEDEPAVVDGDAAMEAVAAVVSGQAFDMGAIRKRQAPLEILAPASGPDGAS